MQRGCDLGALHGGRPPVVRARSHRRPAHAGLAAGLLLLSALVAASGEAGKPKCRLERLDATQIDDEGRVKVTGGVVELEGQLNTDRPAAAYRLLINGKPVAKAEKLEPFEKTGQELYVVLAVEVSALYAPVIDQIKEAVREFLNGLPPRTKVKLISFGYEIHPLPAFLAPPALGQSIDDLTPEDEGDVQLLNALSAGLNALNRLPGAKDKKASALPPRKVLVVLSDGLNQLMDRKNFKRIGDLLKNNGVPLFPVAFSPRDDRGPLLNLGELAKRSHGTFRWAQKAENLKDQFTSLAEELRQSPVLTFPGKKLDADELRKAAVSLQCGDLKSNPAAAPLLPPDGKTRWWVWLIGIVLTLVGLWGAAQGALWLLKRRAARAGIPPSVPPGQPLVVPQPGIQTGGYPAAGTGGYPAAGTGGYPAAGTGGYPAAGTGGYPAAGTLPVGTLPPRPGRLYTATLIGIGPLVGTRVKVEASLFIGRAVGGPNALPVPNDPSLAPTHCELRRDAAGFVLIDLGAGSGCYINDKRVAGQARIQDGDVIRLGADTQLKFRLDD